MYLVQDYKVANECKGSALWAYVLVAMILALGHGGAKSDDKNNAVAPVLICLGLIDLGLAIWGGIELFEKSCDELEDSNIWKFGLAVFILQLFLATFCLVIIPAIILCDVCFESRNLSVSSVDSTVLTSIMERKRNEREQKENNPEDDLKVIIPEVVEKDLITESV